MPLKYRRPAGAKKKQQRPPFAPRFEACPIAPGDEAAVQAARADHLCELAWDGHRMLAIGPRLIAADHRDWTKAFDPIVRALRGLAGRPVLDGFVCVLDAAGRPSFDAVKAWAAGERNGRLVYVAIDVLERDGEDLRPKPLRDRRAALDALLGGCAPPLMRSEPLDGDLPRLRASLRELGVDGVLARRWDAPYGSSGWRIGTTAAARTLSAAPKVTNAQKVLYPRDGITKQDVVGYYAAIAPALLPQMRGRPIVCQRWPDGIDDFTWFQHRVPPRAPDYLQAVVIDGDRRILIENPDALGWMANQAALVFHGWLSRVQSLEEPDWVVIDLDPGERTRHGQLIEVAIALRKLLELLELPSVVKTSGQKGLHVLIPLAPGHTPPQAHALAEQLAKMIAEALPAIACTTHDKLIRKGRLFVDHLQNFTGKTLVLPYSLRANDRACVSAPVRWDEVTPKLDPTAFTLKTIQARLDAHGDLAAGMLAGKAQLRPVLERLGLREARP